MVFGGVGSIDESIIDWMIFRLTLDFLFYYQFPRHILILTINTPSIDCITVYHYQNLSRELQVVIATNLIVYLVFYTKTNARILSFQHWTQKNLYLNYNN